MYKITKHAYLSKKKEEENPDRHPVPKR